MALTIQQLQGDQLVPIAVSAGFDPNSRRFQLANPLLTSGGQAVQVPNLSPALPSNAPTPFGGPTVDFTAIAERVGNIDARLPQLTPVAPQFTGQAPVPIRRPPPEFFQNLFNQRLEPVQQEFFGTGGRSDVSVDELNRRGLLTRAPSGVAGQLFESTVTEPYARATANVQNEINILRAETEFEAQKFDTQQQESFRSFMGNLLALDQGREQERAVAQRDIDNQLLQLETDILGAQSGQDLAILESKINIFNNMVENQRLTQLQNQRFFESLISTPGAIPAFGGLPSDAQNELAPFLEGIGTNIQGFSEAMTRQEAIDAGRVGLASLSNEDISALINPSVASDAQANDYVRINGEGYVYTGNVWRKVPSPEAAGGRKLADVTVG